MSRTQPPYTPTASQFVPDDWIRVFNPSGVMFCVGQVIEKNVDFRPDDRTQLIWTVKIDSIRLPPTHQNPDWYVGVRADELKELRRKAKCWDDYQNNSQNNAHESQ